MTFSVQIPQVLSLNCLPVLLPHHFFQTIKKNPFTHHEEASYHVSRILLLLVEFFNIHIFSFVATVSARHITLSSLLFSYCLQTLVKSLYEQVHVLCLHSNGGRGIEVRTRVTVRMWHEASESVAIHSLHRPKGHNSKMEKVYQFNMSGDISTPPINKRYLC